MLANSRGGALDTGPGWVRIALAEAPMRAAAARWRRGIGSAA
ncbi:hypothetical protein BFL36_13410 [Clavibacter michiganensis]|uniref:Uncharacterized protein n=1 Tax=Clavibacter michiganensis TaxID=28447 RepID=A0A251Y432_9MICO|nr:hypothetical protein BFL36_13410 [Clavibacter michiganensis]